ncbi:zincin-like metallopeptidase domain-containing protein [Cupriavidus basilensis]
MAANDVRDYRQALTDKIIEQLQAGTAPWQKPWDAREGGDRLPYNATTGKPYRGANSLWLSMVGGANGFEDSRWCTFKQAEQQGWQVRKGSKGVRIEFYRFTDQVPMVDGQGNPVLDAEGKQKKQSVALERPIRTTAVVFNVGQMDGVPELAREPRQYEWEPEARAEQILQASGARIFHDQNDRAFYTSLRDEIHLPSQDQFRSPAAYYGTALHELGHWTGHESRLNRKLGNSFGSPEYAKEELRAELASYFLADQLGIPHEPGHHASYVASWVQALQNDHNEIFRAAADAQKITEYVLGLDRDKDLDKDASPERELGVREVGGREAGEAPGGATVRRERREPQPGDTILNTPYKERAEAGQLGAQWAPAAKTWYVPPGVDVAAFGKWAPLPFEQWEANGRQHSPAPTLTQPAREAAPAQAVPVQEAPARTARLVREPQPGDTIISAPYEARREARALGAQWAKQAETWYLPPGVDPAAFAKFAPITAFEQWHANGRQHGPAQGLAQPAPMEPTAVGQLPRNQLAGFVGDAVNRVRDLADKTGLTQHVWDRSVDGLVAAQIANRIPESAFATIDRDAELNAENKVSARINAIRSLRASLGIPSQDDPAEFKAWQASVQPAIAAARDNAPEAQPQRELAAQQARLAEERIARDPNSTREQIADAKAARKEAEGVAMRHDPAIQRVAAAELAREAAPAPFMLVRVQDGLHGASLEGNGLYLPYSRSDEAGQVRNTMHWTVNSIVSDHAYGQFNTAADGSLKGKVVIIADPRELPAPAGLGQVDTWFRLDAREVDGQPARGLGVGPSAVIVAPHDVAVPAGANVLRYSGGVAERDAAVRSVLQQNGVALQGAGMWGWSEGVDSKVWAAETVKAHYPGREADIHVGPHTGSVDERIESLRPAELVERLKTERLYDKDDGSQVPLVEVIKERIDEGMGLISGLQKALPDSEQARIGGFYEKLATDLEGHWKAAQALDRAWQASLTQDVPPPLEPSMPPPLGEMSRRRCQAPPRASPSRGKRPSAGAPRGSRT